MSNEAKKVSAKLWVLAAGLHTKDAKEVCMYLMYGTENGGINLGHLTIEKEVGDVSC